MCTLAERRSSHHRVDPPIRYHLEYQPTITVKPRVAAPFHMCSNSGKQSYTKYGKDLVKNVVKSHIFGYTLTEIYQFVSVLSVFALFAFHVHVAGGTLST